MGKMGPFKTLFVDGFDPEQIWEEIQLRNEPLADYAEAKIDYLLDHSDEVADDLSAFEAKSKRPKVRIVFAGLGHGRMSLFFSPVIPDRRILCGNYGI